MTRQLFLIGLTFFYCGIFAHAKPPEQNTVVVPSPKDETPESVSEPVKNKLEQSGYASDTPLSPASKAPLYHLPPRPSLTLALSRAYETSNDDHSGWIGVHVAPWMSATTRTQIGLDIHRDHGWLQVALHSLPTRNLYRLYWGGGISLVFDSDEELRPLLRLRNYHAFLAGGWELQVLRKQNVRFEVSFHQGTKTGYAKGTVGYTFLF